MTVIVVAAYNRPTALGRLLESLTRAEGVSAIPLVISVDYGGDARDRVLAMAETYRRHFTQMSLRPRSEPLGLKAHILSCADLVEEFGTVVLLEDDLVASPHFLSYVEAALDAYEAVDRNAGVSLYSHQFNEAACLPFVPLVDGTDGFFLQVPSSWGQLWTAGQWRRYRDWQAGARPEQTETDRLLPANVRRWDLLSWKREYQRYLVETDRFIAYPRSGLTTTFGDRGVHHGATNVYQAPLLTRQKSWRLGTFSDSPSCYDAHGEIRPECLSRMGSVSVPSDVVIDLYGTKRLPDDRPCLSQQSLRRAEKTFGLEMRPHEMNIVSDVPGSFFRLGVGRWRHSPRRRMRHVAYMSGLKWSAGLGRRVVLGE
jgi:hypothetical protein